MKLLTVDKKRARFSRITTLVEDLDETLRIWELQGLTPDLPIGLKVLDDELWGLHKEELLIIGGRPGAGKTALAMQIGFNLASLYQKAVLFISLELSKRQIMERLLCYYCEIPDRQFRRKKIEVEDYPQRLEEFRGVIADCPFLIIDDVGSYFSEIESVIEQLEHKFEVLVIDYIQLIRYFGNSKREAMMEYVRRLRELAKVKKIAVILCSQLNRRPEERRSDKPKLSDLKESGALEEIADTVILLYPDHKKENFWLLIDKNRWGNLSNQRVLFEAEIFKFRDT